MSSRVISTELAEQQFDRLFDKYLEITAPSPRHQPGLYRREHGTVQLEAGGQIEYDEVYADNAVAADQEDKIGEVARELARLGDTYNEKFGHLKSTEGVVSSLTTAFTVPKLEYKTFETAMESQIPLDPNAANFAVIMNITGKVIGNLGTAANTAKTYFRRFISERYVATFAEAGGVRPFVGHQV